MAEKKKWYETWWGLLWTLALVDANPGRGLRTFMEVDRELADLPLVGEESPVPEPSGLKGREATKPCRGAVSAVCPTS